MAIANAIDLSPKSNCDQLIEHSYFKICYSAEHRQANWTFHKIDKTLISGSESRTNDYRFDPRVSDPVDGSDYRGSGFDRGHLVPAGDMKLNYTAMSESFYMSNMSPQRPSLNRAIWRSLEMGIRSMVSSLGEAYIVTAPLLTRGLPRLNSDVSIPQYFYKIVYFPKSKIMRAYLLENKSHRGHRYTEYQVTVDEIEKLTNIDFFHKLDQEVQNYLESTIL